MKKKLFNLFIRIFSNQLLDNYLIKNYPLQRTTKTTTVLEKFQLIKVKKGKIRQLRLYDNYHNRIHNFKIDHLGNLIINP